MAVKKLGDDSPGIGHSALADLLVFYAHTHHFWRMQPMVTMAATQPHLDVAANTSASAGAGASVGAGETSPDAAAVTATATATAAAAVVVVESPVEMKVCVSDIFSGGVQANAVVETVGIGDLSMQKAPPPPEWMEDEEVDEDGCKKIELAEVSNDSNGKVVGVVTSAAIKDASGSTTTEAAVAAASKVSPSSSSSIAGATPRLLEGKKPDDVVYACRKEYPACFVHGQLLQWFDQSTPSDANDNGIPNFRGSAVSVVGCGIVFY
jgi:hypothetical protein